MKAKKSVSMKAVVVLMALVLLIGCGVGGTLAWLMDDTDTVVNTFSVGDINIELKETVDNDDFKVLPGTKETKDPVVTVKADSEDCWVFIQVQELNNVAKKNGDVVTHKYVTWAIDNNYWTELSTNGTITTYFANKYETIGEDVLYNVLAGQEVSYGESLTKEMLNAVEDGTKPQLIFKAFAVQAEAGTTAADAWAKVPTDAYLGAVVTP